MKIIPAVMMACVAMTASAQESPQDYSRAIVRQVLPGNRLRVQIAGTQYAVTARLPIEAPGDASMKIGEMLAQVSGSMVEATAPLFGGAEIDTDFWILRPEKHAVLRGPRMVEEYTYANTGETIVSRLVALGFVAAPPAGGDLGEVYGRAWRVAMRNGSGFWARTALPRNTWIVPRGAEREVEQWWNGGGK